MRSSGPGDFPEHSLFIALSTSSILISASHKSLVSCSNCGMLLCILLKKILQSDSEKDELYKEL